VSAGNGSCRALETPPVAKTHRAVPGPLNANELLQTVHFLQTLKK